MPGAYRAKPEDHDDTLYQLLCSSCGKIEGDLTPSELHSVTGTHHVERHGGRRNDYKLSYNNQEWRNGKP